jgi:protein-tyrosine phosphatase
MPARRTSRTKTTRTSAHCALLLVLGLGCAEASSESPPQSAATTTAPTSPNAQTAPASNNTGPTTTPSRAIVLDGVVNTRQVGGLVTTDGRRIRRHVLIRSGHLSTLTPTGCQQLAALGVRTIVDLRASPAAAAAPDAGCARATTEHYNIALPKLLPPSPDNYLATLQATEPKLAEIYARLSAPQALPAIVHCVIGRDRASLVTALVLLSLGVSVDTVRDDFVHNQDPSISVVEASYLDRVLDKVAQAGGIEPYLLAHGVSPEQLRALRDAALE